MSLTIFATSGPLEIERSIAAWTRLGLLRRSVWVDPKSLNKAVPLASTPVRAVEQSGVVETELRQVFGDADHELVRVIAVQQVIDDTHTGEFTRALWAFAGQLRELLSEGTSLVRLNVVVPKGNVIKSKGVLDPHCDVNLVVSPEDRPREGALDHGLDRAELFDAHSAFACATIGALWTQAGAGAFDRPDALSRGNRGQIVVVRSSARIVDGRTLPDDVMEELLGEGAASLRRYQPNQANQAANDKKLVKAAYEALLPIDDRALYYRPPKTQPQPPPKRILPKTLRMLVRFWLDATKLNALQWQRDGAVYLDHAAAMWLLEATVVPQEVDKWRQWRRPTSDQMRDLADEAPDMSTDPRVPRTPPTYPFLWPPLRQLCFGLVDSGKLPEEMSARWEHTASVVSHPKWVATEPGEKFTLTPQDHAALPAFPVHQIRPGDSNTTSQLELELARTADSAVDPSAVNACKDRLSEWKKRSLWDKSLVGRLAKHVDLQMEVARRALDKRGKDYREEETERTAVLAKLEDIQHRLWLHLGAPIALVLVLLSWIFVTVNTFDSGVTQLITSGALVLSFAGAVFLGLALTLAAQATHLEQRLENVEARRRVTVAAVREWPTEARRLGALYDILLDWGEIVGWLLHRPFEPVIDIRDQAGTTARRPEAFKLGRSHLLDADLHFLATAVTRDVLGAGWISELYRVVLEDAIPERKGQLVPDGHTDPDMSPAPQRADPDDDEDDPTPSLRPEHARDRLLEGFRNRDCGRSASDHLAGRVRETMLKLPPERVASTVDYGEARAAPVLDFLAAVLPKPIADAACPQLSPTIFSDTGRLENRGKVAQVHLWGSTTQFESMHVPEHKDIVVHPTPESALTGADAYQLSLIRLDMSAGCDETDLILPS